MPLVLSRALRLRRADLDRLTEVHARQFVQAMAPDQPETARALIEDAAEEVTSEVHGLVYLRFEDDANPARAFEGWFLDGATHPSKTASLDGGAFFFAGTVDEVGVDLSQSTYEPLAEENLDARPLFDAFQALGTRFAVKISGPELKANPPFAHATAPPPPKLEKGAMALQVLEARRYTLAEVRSATREARHQLLKALRPRFAGTLEQVDAAMIPMCGFIDPGSAHRGGTYAFGLIFVRLREQAPTAREFDGWFFDQRQANPESYWPSLKAQLTDGRLLVAGTFESTGVEVEKGRIRIDKRKALPLAGPLAAGLKQLGLSLPVTLVRPAADGEKGYFGSSDHQAQLRMFPG